MPVLSNPFTAEKEVCDVFNISICHPEERQTQAVFLSSKASAALDLYGWD